jgi:hypothetical protein
VVKKGRTSKIYNTCPVMFSFQVAQATEWSIHAPLGSYKRHSKQCLAWYLLKYTLTCCHWPLLQLLEMLPPQDLATKEASGETTTSALQLEVHLLVAPQQCPWWSSVACFSCPQNVMWTELVCSVFSVIAIHRIASTEDCLKTEELSANSGRDATDHPAVFWGP